MTLKFLLRKCFAKWYPKKPVPPIIKIFLTLLKNFLIKSYFLHNLNIFLRRISLKWLILFVKLLLIIILGFLGSSGLIFIPTTLSLFFLKKFLFFF